MVSPDTVVCSKSISPEVVPTVRSSACTLVKSASPDTVETERAAMVTPLNSISPESVNTSTDRPLGSAT